MVVIFSACIIKMDSCLEYEYYASLTFSVASITTRLLQAIPRGHRDCSPCRTYTHASRFLKVVLDRSDAGQNTKLLSSVTNSVSPSLEEQHPEYFACLLEHPHGAQTPKFKGWKVSLDHEAWKVSSVYEREGISDYL